MPPSYYLVKPRGQPERRYPTLAQAASALQLLARTPATVTVVTGNRRRHDAVGRAGGGGRQAGAREIRLAGTGTLSATLQMISLDEALAGD